jgi:hypothetical protein
MHRRVAQIDTELAALKAQRAQVVDHVRWLREQKSKHQRKNASQRTARNIDTNRARRPTP